MSIPDRHLIVIPIKNLSGFIMVPFAGIGVLSSGYIIKRYALNCTKSIKYCIIASVLATILSPMFLVSCPAHDLVGVTTSYEYRLI
uniref:NADH dehydrogenase subunit 5 n=1 Tax=Romanomermis culicivorax TaxID=13658 RepID=A0A915JSV0_ROMCU